VVLGIHPKGSRGKNFIEWLVDSFSSNKDLNLFSDVKINPLSNITAAENIIRLMQNPKATRVAHLASSNVLSKADIGQLIAKRFPSYSGKISIIEGMKGHDVKNAREMWLDGSATARLFDIIPPTVEDELELIFSDKNHA
jgi:dTDP-4-dehydrorhamnose reductase